MFTTERLEIAPLTAADAPRLFESLRSHELYRYVPDTPPVSVEALAERYAALAAGAPPGSDERWYNWVASLRADGTPVGTLQATVRPATRAASIAYVLLPGSWGRGYATEGVGRMLEHLAAIGEAERFVAEIDARNERSIAVVERLGFRFSHEEPTREGVDRVYDRSA